MLNKDDVKKIAYLSRISFTEEEIDEQYKQLNGIMEMMDVLRDIDTEGVEPLNHVLNIHNVLRDDEVKESLDPELVLANAPEEHENMFSVPKIV